MSSTNRTPHADDVTPDEAVALLRVQVVIHELAMREQLDLDIFARGPLSRLRAARIEGEIHDAAARALIEWWLFATPARSASFLAQVEGYAELLNSFMIVEAA